MTYNKRKTKQRKTKRRRRRRGKRGGENFQSAATSDSRQTLVEKTELGVKELKEKGLIGHKNIFQLIDWTARTLNDAADEFERESKGAPEPIMAKAADGAGMTASGGRRRRRKSRKKRSRKKSKRKKRRSRKKSKRKRRRSKKKR